jgi:hypothetical protein
MSKKPRKPHSFAVFGYWSRQRTALFLQMSMHREGQIFMSNIDSLPVHILHTT